jgi:hypothetical protein
MKTRHKVAVYAMWKYSQEFEIGTPAAKFF